MIVLLNQKTGAEEVRMSIAEFLAFNYAAACGFRRDEEV